MFTLFTTTVQCLAKTTYASSLSDSLVGIISTTRFLGIPVHRKRTVIVLPDENPKLDISPEVEQTLILLEQRRRK